ncbi:MAG: DUF2314 domain-containing protein [Fibrobacter sp.]|uniref:DUF2314 domain-containing protein n=1 Tax=Fibrobacter sp. TaxID=35828 RepID=UPI0025C27C5E|nr:DUF2314 domain-containing protein [Fibrobacter sp.]MBR4784829.1 DUF2314 domain-containing protein [Fibrobacter sp.]
MNKFSFFKKVIFLSLMLCVGGFAAEDQLFGMTPEMSKLIAPYIEKARATFPAVKKKYIAGDYVREKRQLDVQIELTDKNGDREMVFIVVTQCLGNRFQGIIVNDIQLLKEYKNGDTLSFSQDQVKNWVVVDSKGNEEGNFVGKAIEAFDSGIVGVFFEGVFKKGKFEFKYQDAQSAKYQNSIDGIVSQDIIAEITKRLKASYEKKLREGQKFEEGKPFYTYGIYDFRTGEVKR